MESAIFKYIFPLRNIKTATVTFRQLSKIAKQSALCNRLCNCAENAGLVFFFVCQNYCVSIAMIVIMRIMSLVGMKENQFIRT